jgi:hypothetical protein
MCKYCHGVFGHLHGCPFEDDQDTADDKQQSKDIHDDQVFDESRDMQMEQYGRLLV